MGGKRRLMMYRIETFLYSEKDGNVYERIFALVKKNL